MKYLVFLAILNQLNIKCVVAPVAVKEYFIPVLDLCFMQIKVDVIARIFFRAA